MKTLITALLLTTALPALAASVYECTDSHGRRTYTQDPSRHCRQTNLGRPNTYTSAPAPVYREPAAETAPTPESEQIAAARRQLAQARQNLEDGKKVRYGNERNYVRYQQRIAGLEQAVNDAQQKLEQAQQGSNGSVAR